MKQFFSSISRSTYLMVIITLITCLLLLAILFNHYQRLNSDSIVSYINADEIKAYIHIDDFQRNNSPRSEDFFTVFYADIEKRLNLPADSLRQQLRPVVKRETAVVITKNNDLIFIAKIKDPAVNKLPGSQIFANKYLVIGQSQNSWWQDDQQVVNRLTAWSPQNRAAFIKAYVRPEVVTAELGALEVTSLGDWLTIGLSQDFSLVINGLDADAGGQFLLDRLPYTPVFSLAVKDIWTAGQVLADYQPAVKQLLDQWQNFAPAQWTEILQHQPAQITAITRDNHRSYVLALPFTGPTDWLDQWLIELVAQKFPSPKVVRLPDGSLATELFVQPDHFNLQTVGDNDQAVKMVGNDDGTWELAYGQKDGLLLLGTSSTAVVDALSGQGYGPIAELCPQIGPWSLYYNPLFIPQGSFLSKYSDIMTKIVLYFPGDGQAYGCL